MSDPRFYDNPMDIPFMQEAVRISKMRIENHNHITRDVKPPGQCYSCDRIHALGTRDYIFELEDMLLFVEELYENSGSESALRHLQHYIQDKKLREKHKHDPR